MVNVLSEPLTFQEQTVLQTMQRQHADSVNTFDKLDLKAQNVITVSSVVITIISGFRLAAAQTPIGDQLWIVFILYLATLACGLWALFPRDYYREPIKANWDDIREALELTESDFLYRLLSGYELAIQRNQDVNLYKSRRVSAAYVLLGLTVAVALILAIIQ
jgi:hypothetical protein